MAGCLEDRGGSRALSRSVGGRVEATRASPHGRAGAGRGDSRDPSWPGGCGQWRLARALLVGRVGAEATRGGPAGWWGGGRGDWPEPWWLAGWGQRGPARALMVVGCG